MTAVTRLSVVAWCVTLAACGAATPSPTPMAAPAAPPVVMPAPVIVSGTVAYRERMALPPEATVDVWIVDTSPGIGAVAIVAEATVAAAGRQVPLPFVLRVDPSRVRHDRAYGLKAVIKAGGQTLFANEAPVPVMTHGHPSLVAVMLARANTGGATRVRR